MLEAAVRMLFRCAASTRIHLVWRGDTLAQRRDAESPHILAQFDIRGEGQTIDVHLIEQTEWDTSVAAE